MSVIIINGNDPMSNSSQITTITFEFFKSAYLIMTLDLQAAATAYSNRSGSQANFQNTARVFVTVLTPDAELESVSGYDYSVPSFSLSVAQVGESIHLTWPEGPWVAQLESAQPAEQLNWRPVAATPSSVDNQLMVSLPSSGSGAFFRLHRLK